MACHGFDFGKFLSPKLTKSQLRDIAQEISKVDGVLWSHVVHQCFDDRWDVIWERWKEVNIRDIQACVPEGHTIHIDSITVENVSFGHGGVPGKHPKDPSKK